MAIKTILLHMAPDPLRGERLAVAVDLARRHNAHIEVAYLTAPAGMPAAITGRGASAAYLAEATAIAEEKAEGVKEEVRKACAAAGVAFTIDVAAGDYNEVLARRSICADLVVVSERSGLIPEDYIGLHKSDELLMTASCPVLIVPKGWTGKPIGTRILVAWKDTREASRAVRGAMPLIEAAECVWVLSADEPHRRFHGSKQLVEWLDRHAVTVTQESDIADPGDNIGAVILSYAADLGADLVVMGVYGHSRWREIVLGGVSAHVLAHMDVPVLTGH